MSARNKTKRSRSTEERVRRKAQLDHARRKAEEAARFDKLMEVTDWTCQSD